MERLSIPFPFVVLLLVAFLVSETGCSSIYHRTRTQLPSEPEAELGLRLAEAERAERLVNEAGKKLRTDLRQKKPQSVAEAGFDRLEAAAFELDRRVLAAQDAAAQWGKSANSAGEFDRLHRQANSWLKYVQERRAADPATQLEQLEILLQKKGSAPSARICPKREETESLLFRFVNCAPTMRPQGVGELTAVQNLSWASRMS